MDPQGYVRIATAIADIQHHTRAPRVILSLVDPTLLTFLNIPQ